VSYKERVLHWGVVHPGLRVLTNVRKTYLLKIALSQPNIDLVGIIWGHLDSGSNLLWEDILVAFFRCKVAKLLKLDTVWLEAGLTTFLALVEQRPVVDCLWVETRKRRTVRPDSPLINDITKFMKSLNFI
jgi:hypothetical protein